ncbi:MAG: thioredoxin family protein [Endomicrobia bacterium]|nr:thioredoxin family protein [Endomicrobiia bacterium]MCL2799320.1 thioredoxin family protein [Endomicrobiia bacterium]
MEIKVLGTGCAKCKTLMNLVDETIKELNIEADIEKIEDINKIVSYGVMNTPALVINNKVVLSGSLPSKKELAELISKN